MKARDPFWVACAVIIAVLAWGMLAYRQDVQECHKHGGVYLKGPQGMECLGRYK